MKHHCLLDSSAVEVSGGHARIRIYTTVSADGGKQHHCGAITTQGGSFLNRYGYWEASVRYQYRPGMHCGFWVDSPMITNPQINNPQRSGTEIDVFERLEAAGPTSYDHAVWWNEAGDFDAGLAHEGRQDNLNDGKFHRFGVAWKPDSLDFYVDGVQTWHLLASDVAISNIPEYIILDTELTTADHVPPEGYGPLGSSSNAFMEVDYVRVYPYALQTHSTTLEAEVENVTGDTADQLSVPRELNPIIASQTKKHERSNLSFDLHSVEGPILQATLYLTSTSVIGGKNVIEVTPTAQDQLGRQLPLSSAISGPVRHPSKVSVSQAGTLVSLDVTAGVKGRKRLLLHLANVSETSQPASVAFASPSYAIQPFRPRLVIISGGASRIRASQVRPPSH